MAQVTGAAPALPPIRLRDMGAFHIGGRDICLLYTSPSPRDS